MDLDAVRDRRRNASDNLLGVWGIAIIPNVLEAFDVELPDAWWWHAIRYGLSALWLIALFVWLRWLWREQRLKREASRGRA